MRDKSLNDSDIKFLEQAGDTAVTVDESLFEVKYPYTKVTGCLSVCLYRRISLTAEPIGFSLTG